MNDHGAPTRELRGLSSVEATALLERYGPNALPETPPVRWWVRVGGQLRSSIIYILLFALVFDLVVWISEGAHEWPFESIAIATILVFNTVMGVWQEYRAEDALARLRELAAPTGVGAARRSARTPRRRGAGSRRPGPGRSR